MDEATRITQRRRLSTLTLLILLTLSWVVITSAPPSYAAPPGNDSIENARAITGVPNRIVQHTREATASATDGACVGGDSVWYRFRPTTTTTSRIVTVGSDFDTMVAVFRGPLASRALVACNDDAVGLASAVQLRFAAGATYWIAVSACCDEGGEGGRSVLTLYRPRPAALAVTLDTVETGIVSGRLFASGTVKCNTLSVAFVAFTVSQRVGTSVARGSGFADLSVCNPTARVWAVRVDSDTAVAFQEGPASVTVRGDSFDGFNAAEREQSANVQVGSNPNRVSGG